MTSCVLGCGGAQELTSEHERHLNDSESSSYARSLVPAQPANERHDRCLPAAAYIIRAELGLSPIALRESGDDDAFALLQSLELDAQRSGTLVKKQPLASVLDEMIGGPMRPVLLPHHTGHLSFLVGVDRHEGAVLYQLLHGDRVSLLSRDRLLACGFTDVWTFGPNHPRIPFPIGSGTIHVDRILHIFGSVRPHDTVTCPVTFSNSGSHEVVVEAPKTSCGCTIADVRVGSELAPGDSLTTEVSIKVPELEGMKQSVSFAFREKATDERCKIELALLLWPEVLATAVPKKLDFGLVLPGTPVKRILRITENGSGRMGIRQIDVGDLPLTHKTETHRDPSGVATHLIHFEATTPSAHSTPETTAITLHTTSSRQPTIVIPVALKRAPPFLAEPSTLSLGTIRVNEAIERTIAIRSTVNDGFAIRVDEKPDECSIMTIGTAEISVATRITKAGPWSGGITIRIEQGGALTSMTIPCAAFVTN